MKRKTEIPRPFLAFIFVNLILGFDLGFVKHLKGKWSKIVCHLIQLPMILTVSYMLFQPTILGFRQYICIAVGIQYVINIVIFKVCKYNVFDLIDDIIGIDVKVLNYEGRISIVALLIAFFTYALQLACVIVLYVYVQDIPYISKDLFVLIVFVCSFVSDIICVVKMLVFYYINKSVDFLKQVLKINSADVEKLIDYYIEIIDIYDKIMPLYEKLLVCALIVNMSRVLMDMWDVAKAIREDEMWMLIGGRLFYLMNTFMKFCGPAIVAEMCNSKIKDIKQIINDRWSLEDDKQKKEQLLNWSNYIECRNLQFKACGVLPIDLRLVIALAQFAITHLIVLLQFTHVV